MEFPEGRENGSWGRGTSHWPRLGEEKSEERTLPNPRGWRGWLRGRGPAKAEGRAEAPKTGLGRSFTPSLCSYHILRATPTPPANVPLQAQDLRTYGD